MIPRAIKDQITRIAIKNNAEFALVFGSFARNTHTKGSDIDIIFIENTSLPFLQRLGRYFDDLSDSLKMGIDVFVYTPAEYENMKDLPFLKRAITEGEVVYESGKVL